MWFSPAGGYGGRKYQRIFKTMGQGYEKNLLTANIVYQGFCPAGKFYHYVFKQRICEETRAGVSYFKLDNIGTTCIIPSHHHKLGRYSKTAITDSLIDIINSAHKENPNTFFNITVGTWLSPFWLFYADCVWMGGMDYGFSGPGSSREKNITYKDQNLYDIYRIKDIQFPLNAIMTHGIIKGNFQFKETSPISEFERDVIMYLGRGVSMWELYISPDILTEEEWKTIAKWIKWAKDNWQVLKNTKMVLGNPNKLDVYGYLHLAQDRAILVLRNPSDKYQSTKILSPLPELKEYSYFSQIYPEDIGLESLSLENLNFEPFEVKIIIARK